MTEMMVPTTTDSITDNTTLRQEIAQRIRQRLEDCVAAVLDVGDMLIKAKDELPHGSFEIMVKEDLRWSPQTARKFMAIARHPVLSDRARVRDLPPNWGTLAELAKVEAPKLEKALAIGFVHPDLTRDDARSLIPQEHKNGRHEERRRPRDEAPQPHPSPREELRGITKELAELIGQVDALYARAEKALESGQFGKVRKKVPEGEKYGAVDHLNYLIPKLRTASLRLGYSHDALADFCGRPMRDQA
jgi:hypothetical protein